MTHSRCATWSKTNIRELARSAGGILPTGPLDAITDVAGVEVGQVDEMGDIETPILLMSCTPHHKFASMPMTKR